METEVQKNMNYLFERIIDAQMNHHPHPNFTDGNESQLPEKMYLLKRDFRTIFISREEYSRVLKEKGGFSLLYECRCCSYNSYTNWFLYNSENHNRVFMVWINLKNQNDLQGNEYLGMSIKQDMYKTNQFHQLCFDLYLKNENIVIGGFRDDIERISQI